MNPVTVPFFIAHLGCPHRCVFCDQEKIAGASGRLPDAGEMLAKIASYAETAGGRDLEVAFFGGSFTALPAAEQRRLLAPLNPLISRGEIRAVRLSTRPDAVDAGTVSFLKSMGVSTVELGVQSLDDEVLRLAGRGHTARDVEEAAGAIRGGGLALGVQLMPGLPGDDRERSLATLDGALALAPDFLRIYPTLVLEGTALATLFRAGSYAPLTLEEALSLCKTILLRALRRGVPVLRMGLQPTAELDAPGVLLAGPYHPAFGQLVESELFFDLACTLCAPLPGGARVTLSCAPGRVSDVVGQKRRNVVRLAERHGTVVEGVREEQGLPRGSLVVHWQGETFRSDLSELSDHVGSTL